ncbi:MAG TPA: pirin family protein [bacterium]|jgi:redox-sensitive bicupin YhaK (pirin superfamily)|nr:pirin family protein [bacterium]
MSTKSVKERGVTKVGDSYTTLEGPGIPIRRPLPTRTVRPADVDPFLLLDHADLPQMPEFAAGEGTHRHRGFEVITYVLEGSVDDQPGEGPIQHIEKGGLQKITTGSGISHGGAPSDGRGGRTNALQIWINLAHKDKKATPVSQVVAAKDIPEVKGASSLARVLVGPGSPTRLLTPALLLDVAVQAKGDFAWDIPYGFQGYAYVLDGDGHFGADAQPVTATQIAVIGPGERFTVRAGAKGLRFFLAAGEPHREPIRWDGPFVD